MSWIFAIKNRYFILIILPLLLFSTRYYLYFVLRIPVLEREGIESNMTFQSFLLYNYFLGLLLMFIFLLFYFLILKGITFLWGDYSNKKILKILLVSYCLYFIPDLIRIFYFSLFHTNFQLEELRSFSRLFYLEPEFNISELGENVGKIIMSRINSMDFVFFLSVFTGFHYLFENISVKIITSFTFILAIIHFGLKISFTLFFI